MNFEKNIEGEDKQLIHLLTEGIKELPSDQLEERTMSRISEMHAEKRFEYRPLRIPLYIMTAIALLLLVPFLIPMMPNSRLLDPLSEFLAHPEISFLKYTVWCWLAVVALWIARLLILIQSKIKLNSFKL